MFYSPYPYVVLTVIIFMAMNLFLYIKSPGKPQRLLSKNGLSYLLYNRAEPGLGKRGLRKLKTFLLVAGISLGVFIISVVLHNAIYGLFEIEDSVSLLIAVASLVAFEVGLIGSLVMSIKGLSSKAS